MRRVVDDILADCADFLVDGDLRVPQHASMVTALAGRPERMVSERMVSDTFSRKRTL